MLIIHSLFAQNIERIAFEELTMWELPDSTSNFVGIIPLGTNVTIEEDCDCEWVPVEYNGKMGYITTKHLITKERLAELIEEYSFYITTTSLNIRESRSTQAQVIGKFTKGQTIYANKITGDWAHVTVYDDYSGHQKGYVHKGYLKRANNNQIEEFKNKSDAAGTTAIGVKYYTNSFGERVQSPTYYSSAPQGATALCRDGTYSFSRNRRGTCSHHGGVSRWL